MATDTESQAQEAANAQRRPLTQIAVRRTVDLATILGIGIAFGLFILAILLDGSPAAFLDARSLLIVLGGTFGVTTACYSLGDIVQTLKGIGTTIFHTSRDPQQAALQLLQLAQIARYRGVLSLQEYAPALEGQPLLEQGINMVIDGTPGDEVERIMQREVHSFAQRQSRSVSVLRRASEIAPAMGLIGTLVGLIQMLGNLEDPSTIGPAMAVALLTTFYGAILSNMLFIPLASKLERNAAEDMLIRHLHVLASASIARQENPRRLEMLLNTILPASKRVDYFG